MSKKLDKALWEYSQELNKGIRPDLIIYKKQLSKEDYREFLDLAKYVAVSKTICKGNSKISIDELLKMNKEINLTGKENK